MNTGCSARSHSQGPGRRRGGDGEDRTDNRHEGRGDGRQDMGYSRSEASGQGNRKIREYE